MAQNTNLIIGIIVVLLILGGVYWYTQNQRTTPGTNPNNGNNSANGFQADAAQIQQTLAAAGIGSSSTFISFPTLFAADNESIQQVQAALSAQTYLANTPQSELAGIVFKALQAASTHNQALALADQIDALAGNTYCANLTLFDTRDQALTQSSQELQELRTMISAFTVKYPAESASVELSASALDYSAYEQALNEAVQSTAALKETCGGTA